MHNPSPIGVLLDHGTRRIARFLEPLVDLPPQLLRRSLIARARQHPLEELVGGDGIGTVGTTVLQLVPNLPALFLRARLGF
ncbi:hypothetical protein [Dietzia timorensis]|uniref:hypothetical protein n=1 Tax=Dietzia timorensis TaxID=499555 RepID=UPI0012E7A014|nr:hypothetical protein [Dietzia timorensis]